MRTFICFLAIALSMLAAVNKEKNMRSVLESNKLLCDIAENIKEDHVYKMSPVSDIIADAIGVSCSDFSEISALLRTMTHNAISASDIYERLRDITSAVLSNFEEKCDELIRITRSSYEKASSEYLKCKKTVFYVYPGITAMIAILFI